jgi:hypothetical protein
MKSLHVTICADNTLQILPLALPSAQRRGVAAPDAYRRLAAGEIEKQSFSPHWADSLRSIRLSDGAFNKLASGPGAFLTFVISGDVTLLAGSSRYERLVAGDIFLTDEKSASAITLDSRNDGMLLQFGVAPDWPGSAAEIQLPGTIQPRPGSQPKFLRILNGDDDKAYFTEFPELFSSPQNQWSNPSPLADSGCCIGRTAKWTGIPVSLTNSGSSCPGNCRSMWAEAAGRPNRFTPAMFACRRTGPVRAISAGPSAAFTSPISSSTPNIYGRATPLIRAGCVITHPL